MYYKISTLFVYTILMIFFILITNGYVTFGHGLGDVTLWLMLIVFLLLLAGYVFFSIKKEKSFKGIFWISFFALCIFLLKISFLRGAEMPWNGQLFFHF